MSDNAPNPYLDREDHVDISSNRRMPHWNQQEKMQFITFRLADSLPRHRIDEIKRLREEFERRYPRPWSLSVLRLYHSNVTAAEERLLGDAACRHIVSASLRHYNNSLYRIVAYVIMPNHVHLLLIPAACIAVSHIVRCIKSYSGRQINQAIGSTSPVWMRDYFDRLIRTHDHYRNVVRYIASNPRHLPAYRYELYLAP